MPHGLDRKPRRQSHLPGNWLGVVGQLVGVYADPRRAVGSERPIGGPRQFAAGLVGDHPQAVYAKGVAHVDIKLVEGVHRSRR